MQLLADLQELVAAHRLPAAELQAHHQSGAQSGDAAGVLGAGHVSRHVRPLQRHVSGECAQPSLIIDAICLTHRRSHSLSQFNTLNNALARCPHCRKVSSVGPDFARGRGLIFLLMACLCLTLAIAITSTTHHYARVSTGFILIATRAELNFFFFGTQEHGGIYVAYVGLFLGSLFLFVRTVYFFNLKVSAKHGPM